MKSTEPAPIRRTEYSAPDFLIERVDLRFELGEQATRVRAVLALSRNPQGQAGAPLVLDGESLALREIRIDGRELGPQEYEVGEKQLSVTVVPDSFELETEVEIHPEQNLALSGLYRSSGNFTTQCEAQGFRRITYFLDRPDVMARYRTTIVADAQSCPVMLSNGNRVEGGELEGGRHWVRWEDPFPKPSYLFALVAGDLRCHPGEFVTRSGRKVRLEIWVEPQNIDRCEHALLSLQKSMDWDERAFGLEYDLDIYMIVAVSDFNMGAMENKGLNIFNSKFVLASPKTATDDDYEGIEGVIGHEYFHNWTGNRVTCRDWFQLTLKEGLTVFRDQQFTADMTSHAVKRIGDVRHLRTDQFAEDAGPTAHPIRPESYIRMDNFYTLTVYEKGAEVIRMYHTLLGPQGFRRGIDLYFERHDGQAVACDDFRSAMADANGRDLEQFGGWYSQIGTPVLSAKGRHDAAAGTYTLTLSQHPAEGQQHGPLHIPVRLGLIGPDGGDLPLRLDGESGQAESGERVLELCREEQTYTFVGVQRPPVPSILRGFSAPVSLDMELGRDELAFLMAHDSDPFNRWDAGQTLARGLLLELAAASRAGEKLRMDPLFVEAFRKVLVDPALDGSYKALALTLPAERELAQHMETIDVDALHGAREFARRALAGELRGELLELHGEASAAGAYSPDKGSIDRRRMKNVALAYLSALAEPETTALAARQFDRADNMTDSQAALACLVNVAGAERERVLGEFYGRWKGDPLVLDKWFTLQALCSLPDTAARVAELAGHADFSLTNPNRVRSLYGAFGRGNQVRFNDASGAGYRLVADAIIELDSINPSIASRLTAPFSLWRRFEDPRRGLMRAELERIGSKSDLSEDVFEKIDKMLAD